MTAAIIITAWLVIAFVCALLFGRMIRLRDTPSACERDAQDGRGEAGERGGFLTNHNEANS